MLLIKYRHTHATATGTYSSIRGLGYLNQTSLLRKDFKIRGVISNIGHKDRLSFVSLFYQINDGRTVGYGEKKIIAGERHQIGDPKMF